VSDHGRVRSLKSGRILKQTSTRKGYKTVSLSRHPEVGFYRIHRLVLDSFVRPRREKEECRHLNGDPADNRLENICWGTAIENAQDKVRHGGHYNARKTHCPAGHSYAEHGTTYMRQGARGLRVNRQCLACKAISYKPAQVACAHCGQVTTAKYVKEHVRRRHSVAS
jgi:hypothetical protein